MPALCSLLLLLEELINKRLGIRILTNELYKLVKPVLILTILFHVLCNLTLVGLTQYRDHLNDHIIRQHLAV